MPRAFICSISVPGYSLACSRSRTTGRTSRSTKSATVLTTACSSAERPVTPSMVKSNPASRAADGPYFDDLTVGQEFTGAPAVTLTEGLAATHQAITGDRLALTLDHGLCRAVTGGGPLAPPSLVWDIAIGQSTVVTRHVRANLFYRGLAFRRAPVIGDTLRTRTEVVALRQNQPRPGREPTGLAALRITTTDQENRPVLDYWRCAMLPLRDKDAQTSHADDLDRVGLDGPAPAFAAP